MDSGVSDMNHHWWLNEEDADGGMVGRRSTFPMVVVDLTTNDGDPLW